MNAQIVNILIPLPSGKGSPRTDVLPGPTAEGLDNLDFEALLTGKAESSCDSDKSDPKNTLAGSDSGITEFGDQVESLPTALLINPAINDIETIEQTGELANAGFGDETGVALPLDPVTDTAQAESLSEIVSLNDQSHETRVVPVEFFTDDNTEVISTDPENISKNLFDTAKASIQLVTPKDAEQAMTGDAWKLDNAVATLKVELNGMTSVLPVDLNDSKALTELGLQMRPMTGDTGQLTLREAIESAIPQKAANEVVENPEISIRVALSVTDAKKFARELTLDNGNLNTESSKHSSSAKSEISKTIAANSEGSQEKSLLGDGTQKHQGEESVETKKIDVGKAARDSGATADKTLKSVDAISNTKFSDELLGTAERPGQLNELKTLPTQQAEKGEALSRPQPPAEPVAFKIQLPNSGLKLTEFSSFRISIKPENLGQVKVHLVMVEDQLTARLTVESQAAKQAVEGNLQMLKDTLQQAGIKVESFSVDVSGGDDLRQFFAQRREMKSRRVNSEGFSMDMSEPINTAALAARSSLGENLASSGGINLLA